MISELKGLANIKRILAFFKVTPVLDPCHATSHSPDYVLKCRISKQSRLYTVPYFFVRSFRYTASYRLGFLDFQMYREGGRSFDTHARWVARNAKLSISLILRENRGLRTV